MNSKKKAPIVSTLGIALPEKEAQLRELGRVKDPQMRVEILRLAHERSQSQMGSEGRPVPVTARILREVRGEQSGAGRKAVDHKRKLSPSQSLAEVRKIVGELETVARAGFQPEPPVL
jgi:hypothetical protein